MKTLCVTILLALSSGSFGQYLALAADELDAAAKTRNTGWAILAGTTVFGGLMALDRTNPDMRAAGFSIMLSGLTVKISLSVFSNSHTRSAARYLRKADHQ